MFITVYDKDDEEMIGILEVDGWRHIDDVLYRSGLQDRAGVLTDLDEDPCAPDLISLDLYVKRFRIDDVLSWELYKTTVGYAMVDAACDEARNETGREYTALFRYMDRGEIVYILVPEPLHLD